MDFADELGKLISNTENQSPFSREQAELDIFLGGRSHQIAAVVRAAQAIFDVGDIIEQAEATTALRKALAALNAKG